MFWIWVFFVVDSRGCFQFATTAKSLGLILPSCAMASGVRSAILCTHEFTWVGGSLLWRRFHERTINSSTTSESADLTLLSEGGESSHAEEGETREAETDASHWQRVHTTLFNPFMRAPAPPSASGNSRAAAAPPPPPVVFQRLVGASTASTRESPPPLLDGGEGVLSCLVSWEGGVFFPPPSLTHNRDSMCHTS